MNPLSAFLLTSGLVFLLPTLIAVYCAHKRLGRCASCRPHFHRFFAVSLPGFLVAAPLAMVATGYLSAAYVPLNHDDHVFLKVFVFGLVGSQAAAVIAYYATRSGTAASVVFASMIVGTVITAAGGYIFGIPIAGIGIMCLYEFLPECPHSTPKCPSCDYPLAGLPGPNCPECGASVQEQLAGERKPTLPFPWPRAALLWLTALIMPAAAAFGMTIESNLIGNRLPYIWLAATFALGSATMMAAWQRWRTHWRLIAIVTAFNLLFPLWVSPTVMLTGSILEYFVGVLGVIFYGEKDELMLYGFFSASVCSAFVTVMLAWADRSRRLLFIISTAGIAGSIVFAIYDFGLGDTGVGPVAWQALVAIALAWHGTLRLREPLTHCPWCDYDLANFPDTRCPECGHNLPRDRS